MYQPDPSPAAAYETLTLPWLPCDLSALAEALGGALVGPDRRVLRLASLEDAGEDDLSFFADPRYQRHLEGCAAGGVIVSAARPELRCGQIVVADPEAAFWAVAEAQQQAPDVAPGVHPTAWVHPEARVNPSAAIGPMCVIERDAYVSAGAVLVAQVYVGEGAVVHRRVTLHPGVKVLAGCEVGARSVLHAGVVIGADGFGYRWDGTRHRKEPQLGRVVIEADVEIGACSCVDRAALGETRVGAGARIDNLVQVGHGARVGRNAILCGQVGLAGSSVIGDGAQLGGQVGVSDHGVVGPGARVAAQSGVSGGVEGGWTVAGTPAVAVEQWRRVSAALSRLPELIKRVRRLEGLAAVPPDEPPDDAP